MKHLTTAQCAHPPADEPCGFTREDGERCMFAEKRHIERVPHLYGDMRPGEWEAAKRAHADATMERNASLQQIVDIAIGALGASDPDEWHDALRTIDTMGLNMQLPERKP